MILKKFLGKTIEAARKSARQMYGDNFIVLDSSSDEEKGAGITVMAGGGRTDGDDSASSGTGRGSHTDDGRQTGRRNTGHHSGDNGRSKRPDGGRENSGISNGDRSDKPGSGRRNVQNRKPSPNLKALRKYAGQQDSRNSGETGSRNQPLSETGADDSSSAGSTSSSPAGSTSFSSHHSSSPSTSSREAPSSEENGYTGETERKGTRFTPRQPGERGGIGSTGTYSRASIRKYRNSKTDENAEDGRQASRKSGESKSSSNGSPPQDQPPLNKTEAGKVPGDVAEKNDSPQKKATDNGTSTSELFLNGSGLLRSRDPLLNGSESNPEASASRRQKREIAALHKRFDKLESLLDSTLITSNFDYVSHPAFQQLMQTGISTSVIAGWFSEIVGKGIDPFENPDPFMTELSAIIREAIDCPAPGEAQKFMLFTGPSGAGKTHLIMKLALHADFMAGKRAGVVTLLPQGEESNQYYTVMEPFCKDWGIPWFRITAGVEVSRLLAEWGDYDHILIDTPSISTEKESSFRQYWKLRQLVAPLEPLEVHYVVNAARNRYYFQHSSAAHHPLQPDYLAITHLDEISEWGPFIPFLKKMECTARYISTGDSIPYSLMEFNPEWFAQQVLQDDT